MRFFKLALFLCLFISFNLIAQKDSLETKTYDELRTLIGGFENEEINFDLINYYLRKAEKERNIEQQFAAKSLFIEASIWDRNFDRAQDSLKPLRNFSSQHELAPQTVSFLFRIGVAYFYQGLLGKALDIYNEALAISEEVNDKKIQHKLLLQIGYIRSSIGDHTEAIDIYNKSLDVLDDSDFEAIELEKSNAQSYYYLSLTFTDIKQGDSASYYIDKALKLTQKERDSCRRKYFLRSKANIQLLNNDLSNAENNLKKAFKLCQPSSKGDTLVFYKDLGEVYLAKKEYKKAQRYIQDAIDIYQVKEGEEGFMDDYYKLLAKAYKHTGDIEKSNFYLEKYINTVAQFNKIKDTVNQSLKLKEVEDFKNELSTIKQEKNLTQAHLNYLFLGASIIVLLLLAVLLRFYRNKKKNEEGFMDDYYKLLAKAYKHTGDIEKSNFYLEKYINTVAQFNKIKDTVNQSLKLKEVEDFKNELSTIKQEKNLTQAHLNYLFLGASIIVLLLLAVLLRFYRNKKKNEEKFEALLQKIENNNELERITDSKDQVLEEKSSNDVPEETKQNILQGLKKLEEKEYFLRQDCNSYNVARKINTNTSYLSKVVNSHFGKNFNTYINDLRINYAIVRLKNDVIFRSYSIQSIAEEVGYKSADSFSKYFKLNTGLNPSFYIKEIKNIA